MKNAKKLGITLVVVMLVATLAVFTALASGEGEYPGTVDAFNDLVNAVDQETTLEGKEAALSAVETYLTKNPVDPGADGYDAVAVNYRAKKAEMVSAYITVYESAAGTVAKISAVDSATRWLNSAYPTDEDKVGSEYEALHASVASASFDIAKVLYLNIDQSKFEVIDDSAGGAAAANAVNLKKLSNFIKNHPFDQTDVEYQAFYQNYTAAVARYQAATEARYQQHLAEAKISEYGLGVSLKSDFSIGAPTISAVQLAGIDKDTLQVLNNESLREYIQIGVDGAGNPITNGVQTLRYMGARNASNTGYVASYLNMSFGKAASGMVIEFDITTYDHLPTSGLGFQPYSGSSWFRIDAEGTLYAYGSTSGDDNANFKVENCIVPGEWTRISLIYDPDDLEHCKVYIDYMFVGYFHGDNGKKNTIASLMRMGNSPSESGEFSLDNVLCTRGTYFRDDNYVTNMADNEKFVYYCNYVLNERMEVPDRVLAYELAGGLSSKYVSVDDETGEVTRLPLPDSLTEEEKAAINAAIDIYTTFDPDYIIEVFSKENLAKFVDMVNKFDTDSTLAPLPTSASINARNSHYSDIEKFIELNSKYIWDDSIDEENPGTLYNDAQSKLGDVRLRIEKDTNIYDFITIMDAFEKAQSVTLLRSKYAQATEIYSLLDTTLWDENPSAYSKFKNHYQVTYINAPDKIYIAQGVSNARKFVESVNYILGVYPTEEDWKIYPLTLAGDDWTVTDIAKVNNTYGASVVVAAPGWNASKVSQYNEALEYDLIPLAIQATAPAWPDYNDSNFNNTIAAINAVNEAYGAPIVVAPKNWSSEDIAKYNDRFAMDLLTDGMTAERLESTVATYDYIDRYVAMIREIIKSGNYDSGVDGFDTAKEKFDILNEHYYGLLQLYHAGNIEEQLMRFAATDSFIEKNGIISYVQRYLDENDVDYSISFDCENCHAHFDGNAGISHASPVCPNCQKSIKKVSYSSSYSVLNTLLQRYVAYKNELDPQEEDYQNMLYQNTKYFITIVRLFDSATTYAEKKALYSRASEYYYAMNVGSAEAQAAIREYEALVAELKSIECASEEFICATLLLPTAETADQYFAYLVDATVYYSKIDASIDGVKDALDVYSAAKDAYNLKVRAANSQLIECGDAVVSLRANCGLSAIISVVIAKLYSF